MLLQHIPRVENCDDSGAPGDAEDAPPDAVDSSVKISDEKSKYNNRCKKLAKYAYPYRIHWLFHALQCRYCDKKQSVSDSDTRRDLQIMRADIYYIQIVGKESHNHI